jgi:hypothetical protein
VKTVTSKLFLIFALLHGIVCIIALPQAEAGCVNNYTDVPLQYWAGGAYKGTVGSKQSGCWPAKGGSRWITISTKKNSNKYWYVEIKVPDSGGVDITGHKDPNLMASEVLNAKGNVIFLGYLTGPHSSIK